MIHDVLYKFMFLCATIQQFFVWFGGDIGGDVSFFSLPFALRLKSRSILLFTIYISPQSANKKVFSCMNTFPSQEKLIGCCRI